MALRIKEREDQVGLQDTTGTGAIPDPVVLRPKYLTLTWTHTELLPAHLLKGFRVVVFTGSDPNDTSKYLIEPIETGPSELSTVATVYLKATTALNAAVQAMYTNGNVSAWRLISGASSQDPDTFKVVSPLQPGVVTLKMMSGNNALPWEQTFDDYLDTDWNFIAGATANATIQTGGDFGSKVLRLAGAEVRMEWKHNIPFDPNKLYKIAVKFRTVTDPSSGGKNVYVGFTGVAADGTTRVDRTGANGTSSQHYAVNAATAVAGAGFKTVIGYYRGRAASGTLGSSDPNGPGVAHDNVRYLRPYIIANEAAGNGTIEIDHVSIEEMGLQVGTPNLATGGVVPGVTFDRAFATGLFTPTNGGFESWTGALPDGWSLVSGGPVTKETANNESGANSLLIPSATSAVELISSLFPVLGSTKYRPKCRFKHSSALPVVSVGIRWYDNAGALISDGASIVAVGGTNSVWKQGDPNINYAASPSNARYAAFYVKKTSGTGDFWLDQATCEELREIVACVVPGSAQVIATATWTKMNFGSVVYDTHGAFDLTNDVFTAPEGGLYLVSAQVFWDTAGGGALVSDTLAEIVKNGGAGGSGERIIHTRDGAPQPLNTGTLAISLAKGDTIQLNVRHAHGVNRSTFLGAANTTSRLLIQRIGP